MCAQKPILAVMSSFILVFDLFLLLRIYACIVHLFSQESQRSSSRSPSAQFYERRKKSRRGVNAGEGGSRNPPPQGTSKRTVHMDFPRGCMHIDTEIEEVEEDPMKTSDDESADNETYKMSSVPPSENSSEDDV
jgi:hypothetical protein